MLHSYHFIYLKKKKISWCLLAACKHFFQSFFLLLHLSFGIAFFRWWHILHYTQQLYAMSNAHFVHLQSPYMFCSAFFFLFNSIVNGYIIFINMHIHLWMWDSIIHFYHLALNIRYSIFRISFAHSRWISFEFDV